MARRKISCSTLWRSRFNSHSSRASFSARMGSSVKSNSAASSARPILPAALMRGASTKPIWMDEIGREVSPASRSSACRPVKSLRSIPSRPHCTMVRFSPSMRMTSAIVPMAASVQ